MTITTISSRELNKNLGSAKKATASGPVFITDRGKPAYVLLSIERYKELADSKASVVDLLAMPEAGEIEFDSPKAGDDLTNPASLI